MPAAISATERYSLPSIVTPGMHTNIQATSPERRSEFDNVLTSSMPRFRRIAMRRLRNYEDAEDAVQDAMLSAFKNVSRFRGHAQMSTWVGAIVINAVRMQLRRRPRYQMVSIEQCFEDGWPSPAELLADPRPNPEKALERSEWRELAIRLTASLSATQRAALQLRQEDDFSTRNAAAKLGVPEGTLKAQLARGRAKLKKRFQMAMRKPRTQTLKFDLRT